MESEPERAIREALGAAERQYRERRYEQARGLLGRAIELARALGPGAIAAARKSCGLSVRPAYCREGELPAHPRLAALLERRSVVLQRLGELAPSLADARAMVDAEPFNARGYLRAGRVCEEMGDNRRAYDWFSRGLRRAVEAERRYSIRANRAVLDELASRKRTAKARHLARQRDATPGGALPGDSALPGAPLKPPAKRPTTASSFYGARPTNDPLQRLPSELLAHILTMLPLPDIVTCLRVSSAWHQFISSTAELFQDVATRPHLTLEQLKSVFKLVDSSRRARANKLLNSLKIASCKKAEEKHILTAVLTKRDVSFASLELHFSSVNISDLTKFLQIPRIQHNFRHLRSLKVSCGLVPYHEEILVDSLPCLESLEIVFDAFELNHQKLAYQVKTGTFSNLKNLRMINIDTKPNTFLPFQRLLGKFTSLQNLTIIGFDLTSINNNGTNIFQNMHDLHTVHFENNDNFNFRKFLLNYDLLHFTNLQNLVLKEKPNRTSSNIQHLSNIELHYLQNILQNLVYLNLSNSLISFQGLKKILRICGDSLQVLQISNCPNLVFKRGPYRTFIDGGFFDVEEFLNLTPNLKKLNLSQSTDFNDYSTTLLINSLRKSGGWDSLVHLDLSFNEIATFKILELLKLLKLESIKLHGFCINSDSIKLMESNYGVKVDYQPQQLPPVRNYRPY